MGKRAIRDVSTAGACRGDGGEAPGELVPALTIVSHPTARRAGERLLLESREVAVSRNAPDFVRPGRAIGAPIDDPFVSRRPLRFSRPGGGGVRIAPGEGRAPIVAGAPARDHVDIGPEELARGVPIELAERVVLLLHLAPRNPVPTSDAMGMVGESAGIRRVRAHVERVADLLVPVLIRGETGTGKELVASALHARSPRRGGPFVSVSLGAVAKELAAAELFGAQKGAYTGATRDREGFFRAALGGTLFLDEVGEAPTDVQAMLLRALETGEIYPVGGRSPVTTDARVVAATDADLEARIREGSFKAPLLHRLAGYEIRIPPLRERREDIGLLFYHFAREALEMIGEAQRLSPEDPYAEPWLPASLAARLVRYHWPGNIRQLRNLTRQVVIGSRGQARLSIDRELLEPDPEPAPAEPRRSDAPNPPRRKASEVTEAELAAALRACAWDLKTAAERLGIARSSMYDLIERSPSLRTAGDLDAEEIAACFRECGGDLDAMVRRLEVSRWALSRRIRELGLGRGE